MHDGGGDERRPKGMKRCERPLFGSHVIEPGPAFSTKSLGLQVATHAAPSVQLAPAGMRDPRRATF